MYGLKQGSTAWHETLTKILTDIEQTQSRVDPCVYQSTDEQTQEWLIVAIYVDDQLILASSEEVKNKLVEKLSQKLKIKDLGQLTYFFNIKF